MRASPLPTVSNLTAVNLGRSFRLMNAATQQLEWHVIQVLPSGNEAQVAQASNRASIDRLYDWLTARHPSRTYYVIYEDQS